MNTGQFAKGNKVAAKPSKKAVAALIRARLEKDSDNLSPAQFTALVNRFGMLTGRRPRRSKKPEEGKEAMRHERRTDTKSFADRLTGEEAETHRMILEIEAEELETRRKKSEAKQQERNGNTTTPSSVPDQLDAPKPTVSLVRWKPICDV